MKKLHTVFILMGVFAVLLLSACGKERVPGAKNWDVESFAYTNQDGNTISKQDLKGKVWIADFMFTSCQDVCLPMTANMVKLQQMLKDKGIENVEFVSFSVDPNTDKPAVLKEFGQRFKADFENWNFLTGYKQSQIESFAKDSFHTIVQKPENMDQVMHGINFYLIDQKGKVIQYYNGVKGTPFDDIVKHIKILQDSN
ncbi:SCO family protein [Actinomycetes bacterium NPDC127524]